MKSETIKQLFNDVQILEFEIKNLVKEFKKEHGFFVPKIDVQKNNSCNSNDFSVKVKINVEF
jgi:flagellar biosynthesis component FlhA